MIFEEEGAWFAQALEIDYAAQGISLEEVKLNFEEGLRATIHEHLKIYGSIERVLKPAPTEVWTETIYRYPNETFDIRHPFLLDFQSV